MCTGVAFEFPEGRRSEVEAYLIDREGKHFVLNELTVTVNSQSLRASVALYTGATLPPRSAIKMIAVMRHAKGTCGRCLDYVANVHAELAKIGIDDPIVTELWKHLDAGR